MQPVQVFQQKKTGAAMDLGQVKTGMGLLAIREGDKPGGYLLILQKGKFIFIGTVITGYARSLIEPVIFTKTAAVQQLIHGPAAFAAKRLFSQGNGSRCTGVSTMVAGELYASGCCHNELSGKVISGCLQVHDGYQHLP